MISATIIIIYTIFLVSIYFSVFWLLGLFKGDLKEEEKELKKTPLVTVTIPAYNEETTVGKTINSVIKLDYPKDKLEILVVNDGSKDNTAAVVQRKIEQNKDYNIKLINQKNSGKGVALNKALNKAKGEFFICLDADSMVRSDALKKLLPEFDDPEVAIALPFMKVKNPKKMLERVQWHEYLINFFFKKLMAKLDCVHVSPGPFSMYRKKILKKIGKFSENNLTEDLEIAMRAQKHNYKIIQSLSTDVHTYAPKTFKAFYKQRSRWYKGTIFNFIDYRKMFFNSKYGDMGMMHLPSVLVSSIVVLTLVSIVGYSLVLKPLYHKIYDLSFVQFDFMYFLQKGIENFQILDINMTNAFLGIVTFILTLYLIFLASKYAEEKPFRYGIAVLPVYIVFYGLIMFGVWLGVLTELILGKRQKW